MKKAVLLFIIVLFLCSFGQKQKTWLALGDSITYLNDHLDETDNRVTKGYLTRITEKLPNINYINQGHNGWTAVNIAKKIEDLGLIRADLYSIFLGTNDWWHGEPLGTIDDYKNNSGTATVYGAFRVIINKIKSLNQDAKVVLITPMQRTDFVYIGDAHNNAWGSYKEKEGQSLEQFAEAVKAIAQLEGYPIVDLYHNPDLDLSKLVKYKRLKDPQTSQYKNYSYPDFIGIPFDPDEDEYPYPPAATHMTYDGLHPSDAGNQVIADQLLKYFKLTNSH